MWWLMPVIPALWETNVGWSPETRNLRPAWHAWWNPVSTKNRKISRAWWCVPLVPDRRLKQENCLNLGGRGCSELRSLHSSLGEKARLHLKRKKKWNSETMGRWGGEVVVGWNYNFKKCLLYVLRTGKFGNHWQNSWSTLIEKSCLTVRSQTQCIFSGFYIGIL